MPIPIDEYPEASYANSGSSLTSFYDNVIYWELAKKTNQFFVTFEKGQYGIPNNKQESIGTMEITYPHVNSNTGSSNAFAHSSKRVGGRSDAFLDKEEKDLGVGHDYNGFIPLTELKGAKYFQSTLTSSLFVDRTYTYETHGGTGDISTSRTISASYFYPFSSYQLSVLRKDSSIIMDLDYESELPEGVGQKGYVVIPENLHENIRDRLNEYLVAASSIIDL